MKVIEDFLKIKEKLSLPNELELHIVFDWDEGFYRSRFPAVMVGIEGGYNRTLLVHECLHAAGWDHPRMGNAHPERDYMLHSQTVEDEIFQSF